MKSLGEILADNRKKAGFTQVAVAKALTDAGNTIQNKSIYAWEKNLATPNAKQLFFLCKMYGITDIYSTFIEPNPDNPLSKLNEAGREKVLDFIKILEMTDEYRLSDVPDNVIDFPVKERELPLYLLAASAGTGEYLDSESHEMVVVGSEVPEKASFGIRLNGNSMEPRYMNGQIVWVYKTAELFDGDIGIFYLDGQAYCKKLHKGKKGIELLSFNPDYKPIPVTDTSEFKIFGRVIS